MKIAFLLPSLANKGPIIFTLNLVRGLTQQGCKCEIFYFNDVNQTLNFPVRCTKIPFFKLTDFSGFDVVHSTMAKPDIYLAFHRKKIIPKKVCSMHCFLKEDLLQLRGKAKMYIYSKLWIWALKRIDTIIVSTYFMQKYYDQLVGRKVSQKFEIIEYGIPIPQVESIDNQTIKLLGDLRLRYNILFGCGSLIKRKGFFQLINYLQHNTSAAVVLIGDGDCLDELKTQSERLHVSDRVVFLGFRVKSYNYYKYADMFCMSSNSEGFGLAMLEAMALNLPIVCSDLEIYTNYFKPDAISLFEYGNQQSFNSAVDRILACPEKYKEGAKSTFDKYFSIATMSEKHLLIYQNKL